MSHLIILLALGCALPPIAAGQTVDSTLAACNRGGAVLAIARDGDAVYLGGNFRYLGHPRGGGVSLDITTAEPSVTSPRVVGQVFVVRPDDRGGWYIGGSFSHVGSLPRSNLAHILADGSVAPWAPDPDNAVHAIELADGTVYVGGDFLSVGGRQRWRIAAVDSVSGAVLPWNCDMESRVSAIVVKGSTVYAGGLFILAGGFPRSYVAAIDRTTGIPTAFQPAFDGRVVSLALRDTTLYVGGYFRNVDGVLRRCIAAVGTESRLVHDWNAQLDRLPISTIDGGPHVNAIVPMGQTLLVAGTFSTIGGRNRWGLAQVDVATAQATDWDPRGFRFSREGPEFYSVALAGDTLFVTGYFDSLGGVASPTIDSTGAAPIGTGGLAATVSLTTGSRMGWSPELDNAALTVARQGDQVYLGGYFVFVGGFVDRLGLAVIDARTGRVADWRPAPNNAVRTILPLGGKVYVGGDFGRVGGQRRAGLAALDPVTGLATSWDPNPNWSVWGIHPLSDALLVNGIFGAIGGRSQRGIALIDTATGLARDWNAQSEGDVYAVAITDSVIYLGGDFLSMGGQLRRCLAAIHPATGAATPWDPPTDRSVLALAVLDSIIYVGGRFLDVAGAARQGLAAIDRAGVVTPWAPEVDGPVRSLAATRGAIHVGGQFSTISNHSRAFFATLHPITGALNEAWPTVDNTVSVLVSIGDDLYLGGRFERVGALPQTSFAAIRLPVAPPPIPTSASLALAQCAPNPARTGTRIRYALPQAAEARLVVYDLQGRAVATPLARSWMPAGNHELYIPTSDWRPGCYLYRLEASGQSATRKMLVVR
jgi:hypothetical protein